MEKIDLISADYWASPRIDLRLNPKRSYEVEGLWEAACDLAGVESAIVLATSGSEGHGSEGQVKYVVLEKSALLASGKAVNAHCNIGPGDVWLAGLSTFHVGGLGIYARAYLSGSRIVTMPWDEWKKDGSLFVEACDEGQVTVTSLTPVHLFDLVEHRVKCPSSLRGVFIGGGALSEELANRAHDLNWPLWTTYGMTESASQIATSLELSPILPILPILPIWETAIDKQTGRLKIRGKALFSGYLTFQKESRDWSFDSARDADGWFTTGDSVNLSKDGLHFKDRADDLVKVLGELVSVRKLEKELCNLGLKAAVIPKPHPRRGHEFIAFIEGSDEEISRATQFNASQPELEKLAELVVLEELPTTEIGKIDRSELSQRLR